MSVKVGASCQVHPIKNYYQVQNLHAHIIISCFHAFIIIEFDDIILNIKKSGSREKHNYSI